MGDFNVDIQNYQIIIIKAATGSGKSVKLPAEMFRKGYKKIAITEPRIINVTNFFKEYKDNSGNIHPEGYLQYTYPRIKYGQATSKKHDTADKDIVYYTEESFINVFDSQIKKLDLLIIDEVHVNNLSTEVLMELYKEKLGNDPNLKCKLMLVSATLNKEKLELFFSGFRTKFYSVTGTQGFRQTEIWLNNPVEDYTKNIIEIIQNNIGKGNILVFLPSVAIIKTIHGTIIEKFNKNNFYIYELYRGSIDLDTYETKNQTIFLATNLAETGITLDPLTIVIDSGWTNIKFYNPNSDYFTMLKQPISEDDRIQRKGRIGRSSDGVIYYLYTQGSVRPSNYYTEKELVKADYSLLRGLQDIPEEQIERSKQNLYLLGAIDSQSNKTFIGNEMLKLNLQNINYCKMLMSAIVNDCIIPIVGIISMESVKQESIYNLFLCDFWGKWIMFSKKYYQAPVISSLFRIHINKVKKLKNNYDPVKEVQLLEGISDDELYSRIKRCIIAGYYFNTAKKVEKNIYKSVINPEIKGKINSLFYPQRYADSIVFPDEIVYSDIELHHNPDGSVEYNFINISPIK